MEALAEAPHAFCSTLSDWQGDGDMPERWRNRLFDVPLNLIAEFRGSDAGMVSATELDASGATTLFAMWVAPFARGSGVGDALVAAVVDWAKEQRATRVLLEVMEANESARRFYQRNGFVDLGLREDGRSPGPPQRRMSRELTF
ncbi:MAG: GNAT family N-acetyltransferase [Acidobacteriaceae bacterium]